MSEVFNIKTPLWVNKITLINEKIQTNKNMVKSSKHNICRKHIYSKQRYFNNKIGKIEITNKPTCHKCPLGVNRQIIWKALKCGLDENAK